MKLLLRTVFLILFFSSELEAQEYADRASWQTINITPFAARIMMQKLDMRRQLAEYNGDLSSYCSEKNYLEIRKALLQGYFRSTIKEEDGLLIRIGSLHATDQSISVDWPHSICFRIFAVTAFAHEQLNFQASSPGIEALLGTMEAFVASHPSAKNRFVDDVTLAVARIFDSRAMMSRDLRFRFLWYVARLKEQKLLNQMLFAELTGLQKSSD